MFDPRKRKFSAEELKPQPMIKKARKVFIPDDMKVSRPCLLPHQILVWAHKPGLRKSDPEPKTLTKSMFVSSNQSKQTKMTKTSQILFIFNKSLFWMISHPSSCLKTLEMKKVKTAVDHSFSSCFWFK